MPDNLNVEQRRYAMSRVKGKNTKPEIVVRSLLHNAGYRFRLHRSDLPGCPDIVLPKYRAAILIHGCFWHQHPGCKKATIPEQNADYWSRKLARNQTRDQQVQCELKNLGWNVLVIWDCEIRTRKLEGLIERLHETLQRTAQSMTEKSYEK
jgi:DNA mismatch endonuclease (patch repair protein)